MQFAWCLVALTLFVLALIGLKSLGASVNLVGYSLVGLFVLAWVTWRAFNRPT